MLKSLIEAHDQGLWYASIQRFVPSADFGVYEWVTSIGFAQDLKKTERSVYSIEPRLIDRSVLEAVRIHPQKLLSHPAAFKNYDKGCHLSGLVIGRHRPPDDFEKKSVQPKDVDIFTDGHSVHFDDTRFSPKFYWPGAIYKTL